VGPWRASQRYHHAMDSARIVGMRDELKNTVFVVGEGKRRRGSELIGDVIDARVFEYALKGHADKVELECPECRAIAKHRRGARRLRQLRRGKANFYADHRSGCGVSSQRDEAWDSDRGATHYMLVTGHEVREMVHEHFDRDGRQVLRIGLQQLLAAAHGHVDRDDVITCGGTTKRFREFVVAAAHLAEADVGTVRAVWGSITSVRPARMGVFVNFPSAGVLVSSELLNTNATLLEDIVDKPVLVLGRIERGGRGYLVRLSDVSNLHVPRPPKHVAAATLEPPKPMTTSGSPPASSDAWSGRAARGTTGAMQNLAVRPASQRCDLLTRIRVWLRAQWQQITCLLKL